MIHSTKDSGPEQRRQLYLKAMYVLQGKYGPCCWEKGWLLLRGEGKKILKNPNASDSECADAIIMKGR